MPVDFPSELVTAYHKVYAVDRDCEESEFMRSLIPQYKAEWIQYGYFEFNKPENIKPYQRVIIMKHVKKNISHF